MTYDRGKSNLGRESHIPPFMGKLWTAILILFYFSEIISKYMGTKLNLYDDIECCDVSNFPRIYIQIFIQEVIRQIATTITHGILN